MKKLILSLFVFLAISLINIKFIEAQDVLDGVYVKEHVGARTPVPYYHLREADVMWSKKIWRMLDLREKINHPLYYPTTTMDDRMSLINLLVYGMEKQSLLLYDADVGDEFTAPITVEQLDLKLGKEDKTSSVEQEDGSFIDKVIPGERRPQDVKRYQMKEVWFFDKQKARLDVRIVGLCPIRYYFRDDDFEQLNEIPSQVFWAYFPAIRSLLANHEVFNNYNDAERKTFDDIFFKRMFSSYIYKETNVYDNRRLDEYTQGLDAILESERVKADIFKLEHDLWEY